MIQRLPIPRDARVGCWPAPAPRSHVQRPRRSSQDHEIQLNAGEMQSDVDGLTPYQLTGLRLHVTTMG